MLGILASNSTTVCINLLNRLGAIFAINKAVNTDIGKEISNAAKALTNVLITINPTP